MQKTAQQARLRANTALRTKVRKSTQGPAKAINRTKARSISVILSYTASLLAIFTRLRAKL